METFFYNIYEQLPRQGPGDAESTRRAFEYMTDLPAEPRILDIGCGSGMQTLFLAELMNSRITAIDDHEPFLKILGRRARKAGVWDRIQCLNTDMHEPGFEPRTFDVIWAEGSIFVIGFEEGLKTWKKFLKPGGYMAVTDINWFKEKPPTELRAYWNQEYPEMTSVGDYIDIVKKNNYRLIHHFILPESAWWDDYYEPLEILLQRLKDKYTGQSDEMDVIRTLQKEIDIFRTYADFYGYVFYILQRM